MNIYKTKNCIQKGRGERGGEKGREGTSGEGTYIKKDPQTLAALQATEEHELLHAHARACAQVLRRDDGGHLGRRREDVRVHVGLIGEGPALIHHPSGHVFISSIVMRIGRERGRGR